MNKADFGDKRVSLEIKSVSSNVLWNVGNHT